MQRKFDFIRTQVQTPTAMIKPSFVSNLQGGYWAITGLWPLVHMPSFIWVSGPKTDLWLVRTVGLLLTTIGLTLLAAGLHRRVSPELIWLGVGGAASMAFIDFYYALNDVIWDVYMLDGLAEIGLIVLWLLAIKRMPK